MILYFMKQDALEFMKTNLDILYPKYFSEENSDWISQEYGQDAFEVFKEVPDFELCPLEYKSSGEVDFENIQIIYKALKNISESMASDERLWAGLCNKVFYPYIRKRWGYDTNDIKDAAKDVTGIISRFYFTGPTRGYYFRNTISKCWWVGRLTYDEKRPDDPFYNLKVIGSSDLNTKITEIFYNSTFTSNPEILKGLFDALDLYHQKGITLLTKEVLRPAFSYLNAVGGGILLDALTSEEITKILVDKMNSILMGRGSAFLPEYEAEGEEVDSEEDSVKKKMTEKPADKITTDELPVIAGDTSKVLTDIFVEKGDTVVLWIVEKNCDYSRKISEEVNSKNAPLLDKKLLGKRMDEVVYIAGKHYRIKNIVRKKKNK